MTEQPQRSQLELYAQVISAYQRAGFWPLLKQAYLESGNKWRAKGWFFTMLIGFVLFLPILLLFIIIFYLVAHNIDILFLSIIIALFIIMAKVFYDIVIPMIYRDLNKKIRHLFKKDIEKYGSLMEIYREGREIPRYILFRNELTKYRIEAIDVKKVK